VLDESKAAISAIEELVRWVGANNALPRELRISVGYKARSYLLALTGNYDALVKVFEESGMDHFEAEMETLDYLEQRKPRDDYQWVFETLKRFGGSRG